MRQGLGTSDAVKACFVGMGQSRPSISVLFEILARQPRDDKHLNKRLNAIYPRGPTASEIGAVQDSTLSVRTHSVRPTRPIIMELGIGLEVVASSRT